MVMLAYGCNNAGDKVAAEGAIVVTDVKGNQVVLNKPAARIVALFDPAVDALFMLQVQDRLVGIPAETYADAELFEPYKFIDDRIAKRQIATPGSNETANLEGIIQLQPDLVIAQNMNEGAIKVLKQNNIAVYLMAAEKYDQVMKEVKDLAVLTGREQRGEELIGFVQTEFGKMQEAAQKRPAAEKKRVYFAWANGRIFSTAGRSSSMHSVLEFAGVENVCTTAIDQPNINPETLIGWNPDMVVMWNDSPSLFYNKQELAGIAAVQERQIYNLMPMFFYNPHTLKSLNATVTINQWAYGTDNRDFVKEFTKKLYGEAIGLKLINLLP
jgi:iron complex transport system substrate-binding protein